MITFERVSKTYDDGTVAVREFSLEIPSHRTVVLLGSSGCGKTTLLRMVNRMVEPTSGRVLIDGEDIAAKNAVQLRRRIGYVLQQGGLLPHRTVAENIATVRVLNGASKREARLGVGDLLERVGLEAELASRYPAQLSGGQQQRVGVARALAAEPNILLMDEPFGAVDPIVRRELQNELLRLQNELGKTIVFVTHDIEEALKLGDEVVLLQAGGNIAQRGTPAEILSRPANDFVRHFVGLEADDTGEADESRMLTVREVDGRRLVFDKAGRPLGVVGE